MMTNVGPVATEASDTHPIVVLLVPEILLVVVQPVVDGLGHVLRHLDPAAVAAPTTAGADQRVLARAGRDFIFPLVDRLPDTVNHAGRPYSL